MMEMQASASRPGLNVIDRVVGALRAEKTAGGCEAGVVMGNRVSQVGLGRRCVHRRSPEA